MRSYFIIIGSVSFFEKNLQKLSAKGAEFNDVITLFDTVRTAGKMPQKIDSLIVRNNHYHGIVEKCTCSSGRFNRRRNGKRCACIHTQPHQDSFSLHTPRV